MRSMSCLTNCHHSVDGCDMNHSADDLEIFVFWFRRDLRLEDNRGFSRALRAAREAGKPLVPLFMFDENILERLEDRDDARVGFLHKTLIEIQSVLRQHGSDIVVLHGRPAELWTKMAREGLYFLPENVNNLRQKSPRRLGRIRQVFVNHDYEPVAIRRDLDVAQRLRREGVIFHSLKDQVIFERDEVVKADGKPYTVFTPYSRRWLQEFENRLSHGSDESQPENCGSLFSALMQFSDKSQVPSLEEIGFRVNSEIALPGMKVPTATLTQYALNRNTPSVQGTTRLGLHLRFGTVSLRKLVRLARELRAETWLSELIWREFFMQILFHFPHVETGGFRSEYDRIQWRNVPEEFEIWCQGRTGFPIVDAGMRELNSTGFMHNRVRMIVGSFLVKHLLIDWRWGEAYFARKLLDFELSSNNGNWQWVAGSGCDAAPYFRVFNPELQLKKFDPDLRYVKQWIPEYGSSAYPSPMVDHGLARGRALAAYAVVKAK
jgi:deoxyribodipyrimidine photo-lyase